MNNGKLSQDEIDALLKGSDETEPFVDSPEINHYFTLMEQDALGEIGNISFGSSATALSTLLNQKVEITTPNVSVIMKNQLVDEFPQPYVAIQVHYTEGFSGSNLLVIKQSDAAVIADLMLGGDGFNPATELNEIHVSAVQEAMNQMMGSAATSMSTVFSKRVDISPPTVEMMNLPNGEGENALPNVDQIVKISFRLTIGNLIDSNIMQLFSLDFAKGLVDDLMNHTDDSYQDDSSEYSDFTNHEPQTEQPTVSEYNGSYKNVDMAPQPNHMNQESFSGYQNQHIGVDSHYQNNPVQVQPASFAEFEPTYQMQAHEAKNLNMLFDIPLEVTVELGKTNRSVKEILELTTGSIIELDKLAGEPVDILVNKRLVATGEVVVIDENFGVRVTDIISQTDRLKKLR